MRQPCILLLFLVTTVTAQPVTFLQHTDLLHPVVGFTTYADCAVDMNGDYLDDIVRIGGKGLYIDFQQADGSFRQQFFNVTIEEPPTWSICAGDMDNNGYTDLLLASSRKVTLVYADESGSAYHAVQMPVDIASQRSTIADINADGWLDAFVCNDTARSIPFRNDGSGSLFPDHTLIATAPGPGAYAAIWTDYDHDSDIDLYISKCKAGAPPNDSARINLLYRNNGDGTFTDVASQAGVNDNAQSWSTSFEDFDHDGDMDAFVINHDMQNRLYRNNGNGTFTDVIASSGINAFDLGAFENATGDFNNDGHIDIFSDLQQHLYLGNGDLTFTAQSVAPKPGAIADVNADGFLDVWEEGRLWINLPNDNHWITFSLVGRESNRSAIGARVEIFTPAGMQVREVRSGQSYSPMNSLNVHFGTGTSTHIDSVIIRWPSGMRTHMDGLLADAHYTIPEAHCILAPSELSILRDTIICPTSSLSVTAPPGFASYWWPNGDTTQVIEISKEGKYFSIATDSSGCASITNILEIKYIEEFPPTITAHPSTRLCDGNGVVLQASPGLNHTWSNGTAGAQTILVTASGTYTVAVDAVCGGGQLISAPLEVELLPAPPPQAFGDVIHAGDSIVIMALGENVHWYDAPFGGNVLHVGDSLQTAPIYGDTTLYVESHFIYPAELQSGGKPDTAGMGGLPAQGGFLLFEAWQPFTLSSVTVYVPEGGPAGVRFVQLFAGDSLLAAKQFTVDTGANVLELNFDVPVGQLSLRCPQGNLFRNAGELNYPYAIGTVGQVTTSVFGDGYYYYFYDWKIITDSITCISPRTAIDILVTSDEVLTNEHDILVYPNPAEDRVYLVFPKRSSGKLELLDAQGRQIVEQVFADTTSLEFSATNISPGVYVLAVQYPDQETQWIKLIIQ